jgi:hypothetical protein
MLQGSTTTTTTTTTRIEAQYTVHVFVMCAAHLLSLCRCENQPDGAA